MLSYPAEISRPNQGFDGEGSAEGMADQPRIIWCDPQLNDKSMQILINADEDIRVGDLIKLPYSSTIPKSE